MASFDFIVDTDPMASSVDRVGAHVVATTAAVSAMQAAVIKAEKDATDKICSNVDRGFFYLIRSQVTAKMAEQFSSLNAKFVSLSEMSRNLVQKQLRMEGDVARLRRDYYKKFHSLDMALEKRIGELNREAVALAAFRKNMIMDRMLKDVSEVKCFEQDSNNTAQMAFAARIKSRTGKAIESMGSNVSENEGYKQQVSDLLTNETVGQPTFEYIPGIIVSERSTVVQNNNVSHVYLPENMDKSAKDNVRNQFSQNMGQLLQTGKSEYEVSEINREFQELAMRSGINERVYNVMMYLYNRGGN